MDSRLPIQAVTFDVGGTLIQPWPSVGHVYAEIAAEHGAKNVLPETLNRNFGAAWRAKRNFQHTQQDWAQLVERSFDGLCDPRAVRAFFPTIYERFARAAAWRIYDDVLPALDALASLGVRLAVVSNWDERLRPLLHDLRLERYFEHLAISCEVGFSKPSSVIFEHAIKKMGIAPERVLHVGDSAAEDVVGAKEAGLQAMLLDRNGPSEFERRISSLGELEFLHLDR